MLCFPSICLSQFGPLLFSPSLPFHSYVPASPLSSVRSVQSTTLSCHPSFIVSSFFNVFFLPLPPSLLHIYLMLCTILPSLVSAPVAEGWFEGLGRWQGCCCVSLTGRDLDQSSVQIPSSTPACPGHRISSSCSFPSFILPHPFLFARLYHPPSTCFFFSRVRRPHTFPCCFLESIFHYSWPLCTMHTPKKRYNKLAEGITCDTSTARNMIVSLTVGYVCTTCSIWLIWHRLDPHKDLFTLKWW